MVAFKRCLNACFMGLAMFGALSIVGCSTSPTTETLMPDADLSASQETPMYIIGAGDSLNIFVWRNPELSQGVTVRPDGRITTPLIEDVQASGKTPTQLARDMEGELATYIKNPVVTVMVGGFRGPVDRQIRVVGQASEPKAIAYVDDMTVLDVMIAVGGVTEFAAGNRASVVRTVGDQRTRSNVRLDDLLNDGDISANVRMQPGDILIIPEAWF